MATHKDCFPTVMRRYFERQHFRRDVDEFLQENDPSKLARQAQRDVERDPDSYEEAEREGKRRSAGDLPIDKDVI